MTSTENVITAAPKVRLKGYKNSFLGGWNKSGFITSTLLSLNLKKLELELPPEKFEVLQKIIETITTAVSGVEPLSDSYLPQGFEDEEAKSPQGQRIY